jgi:3-hydroxyisobutyrate dehydrogenase-like beta-hydroxyacid dehydrogenase
MANIGLLHPGEMGAAIGAVLVGRGHTVRWASEGRGAATARRASESGLQDAATVTELASASDVVLSVCPPHAALDVARQVAAVGFTGTYVDANAISPATTREVGTIVEGGGAHFVDGGIVGQPPRTAGRTRLYLSGAGAGHVAALVDGGALGVVVLDGGPGAASALKAAYAGWTKGSAALLLTVRALAQAEGVEDALVEEWARSQPHLPDQLRGAAQQATTKGWRWIGEMEEIAAALAANGLPDGFHEASAAVYRRAPREETAQATDETAEAVLDALREGGKARQTR